jgi:hypothetical protein
VVVAPGATSINSSVEGRAFDRLVDQGARLVAGAIESWATTTKELAGTEPGGAIVAAMVTAATWWFDWAKGAQQIPYLGGAGRPTAHSADPGQNQPSALGRAGEGPPPGRVTRADDEKLAAATASGPDRRA